MDFFKTVWLRITAIFTAILVALGLVAKPGKPDKPVTPPPAQEMYYEFSTGSDEFFYAQGACADDNYIYILMNSNSEKADQKSVIFKIDPIKKEVVGTSEELLVSTGSDMTLNRNTNEILVVNNKPSYTLISVLDATTLSFKRNITLSINIYGIAFSEKENCYYVANSGGKAITKLSSDFKKIKTITVVQNDYVWESINMFDDYLYLLGSAPNVIRIYDTKGNRFETYLLRETEHKTASVVIFKGSFFVVFDKGDGVCSLTKLNDFNGYPTELPEQEIMMELTVINNYKTVQGGCCSDKYIYEVMNSSNATTIYVIDPVTWTVVYKASGLSVDHANDMCWNSKTNEVIVVHNAPNRQLISFFDADTLEYKKTVDIGEKIFCLDYDSPTDSYYTGLSSSEKFVRFNSDFTEKSFFNMTHNGYTKQGVTSDSDNLYFVYYNSNCFRIYTKDGFFIEEIPLPITLGEPENVFIFENRFYVTYNNADYTGGIIYRLNNFIF